MLNKVILMGRLTKDPEMKAINGDKFVCNFTVAIDREYTKKGEQSQADFINCTVWGKTAEFLNQYFKKGSVVIVIGAIRSNSWQDSSGKRCYATHVHVDELRFGEKKKQDGAGTSGAGQYSGYDGFSVVEVDGELPFN